MNSFDWAIERFVANATFNSVIINHFIRVLVDYYLFKGLFPLAILCWIWFRRSPRVEWDREMVVATIVSGLISLFAGRLLAHYLPFRVRPVYDPALHLTFPLSGTSEAVLRTWSSFPSDHAMLWASIAMGIFLIWRWVGVIALIHCAVVICLPRVYLGLHYPTDVIVGAAIGILVTYGVTRDLVRTRFAPAVVRLFDAYPGPCYMLGFLFLFELTTNFDEPRMLVGSLMKAL